MGRTAVPKDSPLSAAAGLATMGSRDSVSLCLFLESKTMQKYIFAVVLAAAIGAPAITSAQTAPVSVTTIVCRTPNAGETATANIQNAPVVCHVINVEKIRTAMNAVMNSNLSTDQKAKMQTAMTVLRDELQLEPTYPGFNGNPNN